MHLLLLTGILAIAFSSLGRFFAPFGIGESFGQTAANRTIKYLPQTQSYETKDMRVDIPLSNLKFDDSPEYANWALCTRCAQWKKNCNNQTLVVNCTEKSSGELKCVYLVEPSNCSVANATLPFQRNKCEAVNTTCKYNSCNSTKYCQKLGCPSDSPKIKNSSKCKVKDGLTYCKDDDDDLIEPDYGCVGSDHSMRSKFDNISNKFDWSDKITGDCASVWNSTVTACYTANMTAAWRDATGKCRSSADTAENCHNKDECFGDSCSSPCSESVCGNLVSGKCKNATVSFCNAAEKAYKQLISGERAMAYHQLMKNKNQNPGDPFRYTFVARPNEVIFVDATMNFKEKRAAWTNTTTYNRNPVESQFYAQIQIFKGDNPEPVHKSFVFQRSFFGSFTLRMGTIFEESEPGATYHAQIAYFLPRFVDNTLNLDVTLEYASFIIYRNQK